MSFFFNKLTKNPNLKTIFLCVWGGGGGGGVGGGGGGARGWELVSEFFDKLTKNPNLNFIWGVLGGGRGKVIFWDKKSKSEKNKLFWVRGQASNFD